MGVSSEGKDRNVVFLPRLNATAGTVWTSNNQQQEFTDGTERKGDVFTNNINAAVTLNWTLFDGLKMFALKKKAEEYTRLGSLEIKNQVVNTVAEVINTYYIIVRQKQQLKAIEEQMSVSQTRVDLSKRKLEIGTGTEHPRKRDRPQCAEVCKIAPGNLYHRVEGKAEPADRTRHLPGKRM